MFAIYVAGYCVGRFCVELLRDDAATHIAGVRINSFTSTFVFIGAVVYLVLAPKVREDPESLRGTEYVEEEVPEAEAQPESEAESEPERITGASVAAAAAGAGVLTAGKTAKRLIPRRRSKPGKVAEAEGEETETAEAEVAESEESRTTEAEVAIAG